MKPLRRTLGLALSATLWICGSALAGEVQVITLGGGPTAFNPNPAGDADGNTHFESQFNFPSGLTVDRSGDLLLVDQNNGKIRKITDPGSDTSLTVTFLANLSQPVGVIAEAGGNVLVLTAGDGLLRRYNSYGNFVNTVASGLITASGISVDGSGNFYVTLTGSGPGSGELVKVSPAGVVISVRTGLNQPQGVAVLNNGLVAVSDSGNHAVLLVNPASGAVQMTIGGGGPGFVDGLAAATRFNAPQGLAATPNGKVLVADRFNHRVRLVSTNGTTTTVYGIDPLLWSGDWPGWEDGSALVAAGREPLAAAVANDGVVFVTEGYYHTLRQVTGADTAPGQGGGDPGGGTPVVIPPPVFSPSAGYYPMGVNISVSSPHAVFYTTDGTDPTTNSRQVALVGNVGNLFLLEPLQDLTSLRMRAFDGTNASAIVRGVPVDFSEVGISRDALAGVGSTIVIPVVANLRTNDRLRSIQFRVEITPLDGAPAVRPQFRALSILSNDFVPLVAASVPNTTATYSAAPYSIGQTRGLVVSAIGTNANFQVQRFGTVALLAVPLDPSTVAGQRYQIQVYYPSGTSDGQQTPVTLSAMPPRFLTVSNLTYLVGDSSPGFWYSAGEFGDGDLNNNDVNNAFYASLGVRTPFSFTDVFDSMDAFPPDDPGVVGGDGEIRFLDWQLIMQRSLRLDTAGWRRFWGPGGIRGNEAVGVTALATGSRLKSNLSPTGSGSVWLRQAVLGANSVANALPGDTYYIPVFLRIAPGYSVGGLGFRAALIANGSAPAITGVQFQPAPGLPAPIIGAGNTPNEILCGWSLVPSPAFSPALTGSNLLGHLVVRIPHEAVVGQVYTIRFYNADGAPDLSTQYNFETLPAWVWVGLPPQQPAEMIPDQWKTNFFGSLTNLLCEANADPDGDGVPNWKEYMAGTNPTNWLSRLQLMQSEWHLDATTRGIALRWLSAPGKAYVLEASPSLSNPNWNPVVSGILGDGNLREFVHTNVNNSTQFYRLRVQP